MPKKRPLAPPASPTDEWGIYDPAKAGMQALYSRLGRPILRASAASERRERRRAFRPIGPPTASAWPSRKRNVAPTCSLTRRRRPPRRRRRSRWSWLPSRLHRSTAARATARAKAAKGTKRKTPPAIVAAEPTTAPAVARRDAAAPTVPRRAGTPRQSERAGAACRSRPDASAGRACRAPPTAVPPPSPRRPRGPVPLAAWAHAVHDTRRDEPKRGEAKGLWRGIFRIPSEVALVEYGRGCRIHRVVIETAADRLPESF